MDDRARRRTPERRARRRRGRIRLAVLVLAVAGATTAGVVLASGGTSGQPEATPEAAAPAARRAPVARADPPSKPARLSLPSPLATTTLTVPILMYHRIDYLKPTLPSITRSLTVDPSDFAAQMRWLHGHGYHTITQLQLFNALERGVRLPARPVLLTFDDGYRDVFGKAMPVLRKLRMHATAYVITDRISGPDPSFLTWGMLAGLEKRGFDIGSHTVHHVELPNVAAATATAELVDSRLALEQHLGHPVQWLSYPAGRFDPPSRRSPGRPATCSRSPPSRARARAAACRSSSTGTRSRTRPGSPACARSSAARSARRDPRARLAGEGALDVLRGR